MYAFHAKRCDLGSSADCAAAVGTASDTASGAARIEFAASSAFAPEPEPAPEPAAELLRACEPLFGCGRSGMCMAPICGINGLGGAAIPSAPGCSGLGEATDSGNGSNRGPSEPAGRRNEPGGPRTAAAGCNGAGVGAAGAGAGDGGDGGCSVLFLGWASTGSTAAAGIGLALEALSADSLVTGTSA